MTQRKPWVRYLQKCKVMEQKVGTLDLGRLPKIKVRCKTKVKDDHLEDVFPHPHNPREEANLWGPNPHAAERVTRKGSHSYR